jgi:membrane-bound metal-dependent hydrolase YbcI (DUF457 family)
VHPYRAWPFLSDPHHPVLSAVWAVLIHGALSLMVVLPIVWGSKRPVLYGALAFIGGPALDLDHVVAAGSLDPHTLEDMSHRPDTHSLVVAVGLALLALVLTRRMLAAWSVFAVIVAHLLFDAAGGSDYWLYPFSRTEAIPWLACPLGIGVLTGVSWMLARTGPSSPATGHPLPSHAHAHATDMKA